MKTERRAALRAPVVAMVATVAVGLLVSGCDLAPQPALEPSTGTASAITEASTRPALDEADATQTALWAAYRAPVDIELPAEEGIVTPRDEPPGYPGPSRTPAPTRPSPTATATMDLRGALPANATPDRAGIRPWLRDPTPEVVPMSVPYRLPGDERRHLAILDAGSQPAEPLFLGSEWLEANGASDTLSLDEGLRGAAALRLGDPESEGSDVLLLSRETRPYGVETWLSEIPTRTEHITLSRFPAGEGSLPGQLLVQTVAEKEDVMAAEPRPLLRLYEEAETGLRAVPVLSPPSVDQLYDLDGDGTLEALQPRASGPAEASRYDVHTYRDGRWELADERQEPPFEPPPVASAEGLPPLPVEPWWWAEGAILRWPAAGGALETVMDGSPSDGHQPVRPDPDRARGGYPDRWAVSRDGAVVARLELAEDGGDASLRVLDRRSGELHRIPTGGGLEAWALSPDGERIALSILPDADGLARSSIVHQRSGDRREIQVLDSRTGAVLTRADCPAKAPTEEDPAPYGCDDRLRFSADGADLAFADGYGLRALRVADGVTRTLATHAPPRAESFTRYGPHWAADRWLAGDDRLLSELFWYEGATSGVTEGGEADAWQIPESILGYSLFPSLVAVSPDGATLIQRPMGRARELRRLRADYAPEDEPEARFETLDLPLRHAPGLGISSLAVLDDGRIRYLLRSPGERYRGNALVERTPEGELRWQLRLPGYDPGPQGKRFEDVWAPGGGALVFEPEGRTDARDASPRWLALGDGSALWDVDDLLGSAVELRWVTPGE